MRRDLTQAEIGSVIEQFGEVIATLARTQEILKDNGIDSILIHADTVLSRYLPSILDWAEKMEVDARAEARAKSLGRKSRAREDKEEHKKRIEKDRAKKMASSASIPAPTATGARPGSRKR